MTVISTEGLTKRFGSTTAVSDLDLAVEPGQVMGLLGPNGAGKTTVMRMLVGLVRPDRGRATLLGRPIGFGAPALRGVGALIEGPGFVPHLTGRTNLRLHWSAGGSAWPPPDLDGALDVAGLGAALDRKVGGYSMGMRQRLALAQVLLGAPRLLILDEPATGLDPAELRKLRELLRGLAAEGTTVLLSSHLLGEVEQTCSHVFVMREGRRVAAGPVDELLAGREDLEDAFLRLLEVEDAAG